MGLDFLGSGAHSWVDDLDSLSPHPLPPVKTICGILAALGLLLPYSQLVPWVMENGLDPTGMARELFSTRMGAFFGLDVIVSALVVFAFVLDERRRRHVRGWWLALLGTVGVGVSFGLPLYLVLREDGEDPKRPRP